MQVMMRRMFYVIAIHTLLIFYSAFYLSTAAWGFISGGLFYILVGAMALVEYWRGRHLRKKVLDQAANEEWFDIFSPAGKVIGQAPRSAVHGNPELIHPVVHLHIFNDAGELYLQKRAPNKDLLPNYWDTAVGGHVRHGESVEQALRREAEEELGLTLVRVQPAFRYLHRTSFESELVHSFVLQDNGPFYINREEIAEGRFWKIEEIEATLGRNVFTPNFEQEFQLLKEAVIPNLK